MMESAMRMEGVPLWTPRTGGWLISLVLHGGALVLGMQAVMDINPHLPPETFHWDVVLQQAPPPSLAAANAERPQEIAAPAVAPPSPPQKMQPAPQPRVRQTIETTPVVRTVQAMQPVVQRVSTQERQAMTAVAPTVDTQPVRTETVSYAQESVRQEIREVEPGHEQQVMAVQSRGVLAQESPTVVEPQVSAVAAPALVQVDSAIVEQSTIQHALQAEAGSPSSVVSAPAVVDRAAVEHRAVRESPGSQADFGWLSASLWERIEKLKRYPTLARSRRWEGRVVLEAVIREDGAILQCQVAESSGHGILDQEAISVLKRASPLSLAHPLGQAQITILVPIAYRLDG